MKDSTKIILWISSIVASFFGTLLVGYSDILIQPTIRIGVDLFDTANSTTLAKVRVANTGAEPAMNVRLTINPQYDIIKFESEFQTEELTLINNGPRSLIGLMPRLAQNTYVIINTWINGTKTGITLYDVHLTSDQGSQSYSLGREIFDVVNPLVYSAFAATIAALIGLALKRKVKR